MTTRAPFRTLGTAAGLSVCWLLACGGSAGFSATGAAGGGNAGAGSDSNAGQPGTGQPGAGASSAHEGGATAGHGGSGAVGSTSSTPSAGAVGVTGAATGGSDGLGEAGAYSAGSGGVGEAGADSAGSAGEAGAGALITLDLQPGTEGKDAQVTTLKGHPEIDSTNYGSTPAMVASAWTFSSVPVNMRCFIEFDLSKIPAGARVDQATLSLYASPSGPPSDVYAGHSTLSGSNDFWVETVAAAWSESTITWANQPKTTWNTEASGTTQGGVHHDATWSYNEDVSLDLTPLLKAALKDLVNYHGFMIHLDTEQYYRNLRFTTSDNEQALRRPKLSVRYRPAP